MLVKLAKVREERRSRSLAMAQEPAAIRHIASRVLAGK